MLEVWIRLDDLPDGGKEFDFPEQKFWTERFAAFDIQAKPGKEIQASAHIMYQDAGALVRGRISGSVLLPCDRCAEEFELDVDVSYDEFEAREAEIDGEETRILNDNGILTLNMGEVLWEQLMLALPMRPTCNEECKGICSGCGTNLNEGECNCNQDEGDPRLAVLKGLKVE